MGYPIFGKIRTLTLPIPASDLTSAEYKDAFGIDLENIKLYDLILLCDADKQIHPVLVNDTENKILYTAEGAYSYNGGFAVVEDDSLVAQVVSKGTIENAKPIYYHPIYIRDNTADATKRITMAILDNQSEPYTLETLSAKIAELLEAGATIQANGYFLKNAKNYNIYIVNKRAEETYTFYGNGVDDTDSFDLSDIPNTALFSDGVNKLN